MGDLVELENEALHIIREAASQFKNPACMWSVGKDSTVTVHLLRKAFFGKMPFPVIHIDTGKKFPEMYKFRDSLAKEWGLNLLIAKNNEEIEKGMGPEKGNFECCTALKTEALKQLLDKHKFDALFLAIRRDEHGVRAKERFFSPRDSDFKWNYKDQPPEMWDLFKSLAKDDEHTRVHPILEWTELDVWNYIEKENIPVNPLYFAKDGKRYRCFSEDTNLLTCDGLKGINEITKDSEIATLNNKGELEFQKPKDIFKYPYNGKLLEIKNTSINLLITPNHRLFYRKRYRSYYKDKRIHKIKSAEKRYKVALKLRKKGITHQKIANRLNVSRPTITRWLNGTTKPLHFDSKNKSEFSLKEAKTLFKELKHESIELKRNCEWAGKSKKKFKIPKQFFKRTKIGEKIINKNGKYEFDLKYWLRFFGWYLSEGSCTGRGVCISQSKGRYYDEISKDVENLGLFPQKRKDSIYISNAPLARYLKLFGTSRKKFIPKWIKNLNKELLSSLMDTLIKGDGSFNKDGTYRKYVTVSYKLANDVLEVGLKLGYPVSLAKDNQTWIIGFSGKGDSTPRLSNPPKLVNYKGRVWCVEVENSVIMAERNGKLCWTGNSLGCVPCTSPVSSTASNIQEIIQELKTTQVSERSGRSQDKEKAHMMQKLRALGYM